MKKYCIFENEQTKQVNIVEGKMIAITQATEMEVEQAYNGAWYLKGYAPVKPEPTVEEKLVELEEKYQMPRVLREIILANPNMYSAFIVGRARELEELAEIIRRKNNG